MSDDCETFITPDPAFPQPVSNRPALDTINYRIGDYPRFLHAILKQVNSSWELRHWSHRKADDPGIALLEGVAIVNDILAFYQDRYANEAFMRTAKWRESVADLARLLGYRLSPGVGGRADFAFLVKGETAVTIPAGFPVKTDLEELDDPAEFQTINELSAYPHLSAFHLYRRRIYSGSIDTFGMNPPEVELKAVSGSTSNAAREQFKLQAGDRLLLLAPAPNWTTGATSLAAHQAESQVVKVKKVTHNLGRTRVELEAPLARIWTAPVHAYRLGRSFRHFGHSAPPTYTVNTEDSSGKINGAREHNTAYVRHVNGTHACSNTSSSLNLPGKMIPLDQAVNDVTVNSQIIVQTVVISAGENLTRDLAVLKTIKSLRNTTISFANVNGPTTLLTMNSSLVPTAPFESDVRDYVIHEVTSPELTLRPLAHFAGGAFVSGTNALEFYGTLSEVQALAGRSMILQHEDGRAIALSSPQTKEDFALSAGEVDEAKMWTLSFDRAPSPFAKSDFDEDEPTVTVYANIMAATQGKQEKETVLGNGDARRTFQTFKLPKAPLTYLLSVGATPPEVPELDVYVNGLMWTRVSSLYGQSPQAQVYIVREDSDGNSYVQFGDGETGARLPSGIKNVSAVFRSGIGAYGPVKTGATPSAGQRLLGLGKVMLPMETSGGAQAEAADNARAAAPGRVQGLGRLVSLKDYETELLSIAGVSAVTAVWDDDEGIPMLTLRVLLESGRESEFAALRATIRDYQRCRGPDRFAVQVRQAFLRFVYVDVNYAFDPRYRSDDVVARMQAAMGLFGDSDNARGGLFGQLHRRLGEAEYASRVAGVLQQVEGVLWCRVTALGMFNPAWLDPETIDLAAAPRPMHKRIAPTPLQLLQLHVKHLTLTAVAAPTEDCA